MKPELEDLLKTYDVFKQASEGPEASLLYAVYKAKLADAAQRTRRTRSFSTKDREHRSGSNMSANKSHEQSLFEAALHLKSQSEREAFLQVACATDPELRRRIDQLLAAATEADAFFNGDPLKQAVKITEYCDEKNLSTRERLELFTQVCHAIQHAHQKGIIHRDIKPSNVLVTINDGVVPKVIDFGIAKATTDQRLTDKTVFAAFEQFIGTPAYMSPEQAEITSVDIDTRSDIYSLGVLLYELLTGKTPFDANELLKVGLDEMRRTIREKQPMRPSTKLTRERAARGLGSATSEIRNPKSTRTWIGS